MVGGLCVSKAPFYMPIDNDGYDWLELPVWKNDTKKWLSWFLFFIQPLIQEIIANLFIHPIAICYSCKATPFSIMI